MSSSSTPAAAPQPAATMRVPAGSVIVGTDGSELGQQALEWAAQEAALRAVNLHVVQVFPDFTVSDAYWVYTAQRPETSAREQVEQTAEQLRAAHAGLSVTSQVLVGRPARELVRASLGAALVVVGSRGHGRIAGLLLGSVSQQVAAHARSSVVVVRGTDRGSDAPVVVGVDSSPGGAAALDFALAHAARRGAPVVAVHASYAEAGMPLDVPPGFSVEAQGDPLEEEATATAAAVERAAEHYPAVAVTVQNPHEHPVAALVRASADAGLVVVGSRGLGGFTGLMLGSVSQGVLHSAQCTVAVARMG
jgi:nucleotide-binding universal stress UspA family protein